MCVCAGLSAGGSEEPPSWEKSIAEISVAMVHKLQFTKYNFKIYQVLQKTAHKCL